MIQIKRGKTKSWRGVSKPLAPGQPGFDKDKNKIKIGDGEHAWKDLPYASGLSAEEILFDEAEAKKKYKLDSEDKTLITYGTKAPDKNTIGTVYLQYYDAEPEVDYVVSTGINQGWRYQKWKSGLATCSKTFDFSTPIQIAIGETNLYQNNIVMSSIAYPFEFKNTPSEVATLQSPGGFVWLATSKGLNTTTNSASYNIISPDQLNNATYKISIHIEGFWK